MPRTQEKVFILAHTVNNKAMKEEKMHLGYLLNMASKDTFWLAINTPTNLEDQFASKVVSDDRTAIFCWGKAERRQATIVAVQTYSSIHFRRLDDESEREYFEVKVSNNELTDDYMLEISSFSDPKEADDLKKLWDSQMNKLRRACGSQLTFSQKFFILLFLY